ncbi:feruloyl esterase [Calycina marina]|uniref:Carboxylic ester hydrolase n=1 Tax=Calycina marina TaxID=1763456 RepID=A0A9P8CGC3_9HELO|nr:feruloyl esterase [Calycina marina]
MLPGFKIISVEGHEVHNYTDPYFDVYDLSFCNVTVTLMHPAADDIVFVYVWLPLDGWNGRFLGTGGGGLKAGYEYSAAIATDFHYASAFTEAGLTLAINAFYGVNEAYSYYWGCSTGGRMGYFAAQRHPEDFDGILANAPAIDSPAIGTGDFWPLILMNELGYLPQCIFSRFQQDMILACDRLDGVMDGLISDLDKCVYDPNRLIGSTVSCEDGDTVITSPHIEIVSKILAGPTTLTNESLYPGIPPGASFQGIANTTTINGTVVPIPFSQSEYWIQYFVIQDPNYKARDMTAAEFEQIFLQTKVLFDSILGQPPPDYAPFKARGGKILTWHGLADEIIPPALNVDYRKELENHMGGAAEIDDCQRLFLAPGVGHCGQGYGPEPHLLDSLNALRQWVEEGIAPETLAASAMRTGELWTRNLCLYPKVPKFKGHGNIRSADSFSCE